MSANLLLYPGNPVLLRSVLILVHEEQSCVLSLYVCYALHNKDSTLYLHLKPDTKSGKIMKCNSIKMELITHAVLALCGIALLKAYVITICGVY